MPAPVICFLVAAALPLVAFTLLTAMGKRLGNPLAGYVATFLSAGSFFSAMLGMVYWYVRGNWHGHEWGFGRLPIDVPIGWSGGSAGPLHLSLLVDSLTVAMFAMVTIVAVAVHFFSLGYMRQDRRFPRYFAYLGLFCFSMLGLILGGTLAHVLVFWEGVGFCSYLLIGFWHDKPQAVNAATKAFVVNRIGDTGLLIGLGLLFGYAGTLSLPSLWVAAGRGAIPMTALTVAGLCLFCGTIGKSAQVPLHVWLADAMEGPTPVSALIHAATMVAAGVYLLGRVYPLLTADAKLVIAVIGTATALFGAVVAVVQTDIKRLLAFSTLSQLGYMVLGMGVGSWVGSLFHLVTHAFFKSLLFLGAGSVIHAARHEQEMPMFGGLIRKIPVTAVTFGFGVLALSGIGFGRFGFSGFFSKELILSQAGAFANMAVSTGHSRAYLLLFALPAVAAVLTPFYMGRCWMMTFWGPPRNLRLYAGAREFPIMWWPLIGLTLLAVISGRLMNVPEMLASAVDEDARLCRQVDANAAPFDAMWPADIDDPSAWKVGAGWVDAYLGWWMPLIGLAAAFAVYFRGLGAARALIRWPVVRHVRLWLYHRMFFDELYYAVVVAGIVAASRVVSWFDRAIVDDVVRKTAAAVLGASGEVADFDAAVVDGGVVGMARWFDRAGSAVRAGQSGRVRVYVAVALSVVAVAAVVTVAVSLSR